MAHLVVAGALSLLAFAPGFWGDEDNPQAITITSNWQCPTPSPVPTRQIGDDPLSVIFELDPTQLPAVVQAVQQLYHAHGSPPA